MKMKFLKFLTFLTYVSFLFLSACGGGGGGGRSSSGVRVEIKAFDFSNGTLARFSEAKARSPQSFTLHWEVITSPPGASYRMEVYLVPFYASLNGTALPEGSVFLSEVTTSQGNYTLEIAPGDQEYQRLMEALGGAYYLALKAKPIGGGTGDLAISLDNGTFTGPSPYLKLKSRWTVMVYMGGDNGLGPYVEDDLSEMASVGSSPEVNIVAQADTYYGPAKRYLVKLGERKELGDLGEVNMSREDTLVEFARWVFEHFPADHYLLILWDHGGGFKARGYLLTRNLLWDDHPDFNTSMTIPQLAGALSQVKSLLGRPVDLIGMDACLMAMAEVAYEIRDLADYLVASENFEWVVGWPYDYILQSLADNATMGPSDLARTIVNRFIAYYSDYSASSLATQSAVDLFQMEAVANATSTLAQRLKEALSSNATLLDRFQNQILGQVQYFDDNNNLSIDRTVDNYVDLYHLAELLAGDTAFPSSIRNAASRLISVLNSAILANGNTGRGVKNAYGLSVWLPHHADYTSHISLYRELAWSNATAWDDFLETVSPNL